MHITTLHGLRVPVSVSASDPGALVSGSWGSNVVVCVWGGGVGVGGGRLISNP